MIFLARGQFVFFVELKKCFVRFWATEIANSCAAVPQISADFFTLGSNFIPLVFGHYVLGVPKNFSGLTLFIANSRSRGISEGPNQEIERVSKLPLLRHFKRRIAPALEIEFISMPFPRPVSHTWGF